MNILKKKRKIPKFRKQEALRYRRVGAGYRKPKGFQSKMRQRVKGNLALPEPGYGMPAELRHLHPSGLAEVLVNTPDELKGDPKKNIVRIGGTVGYKKKIAIFELAKKGGFRVANEPKVRPAKKKVEQKQEVKKAEVEEKKTEPQEKKMEKKVETKETKKPVKQAPKPKGSPRGTRQ